MRSTTYYIPLPDLSATQLLARQIAALATIGEVLTLSGDLGVGKTTFSRFFIKHIIPQVEEVVSPTFTLLQSYNSDILPIWHFDLYRLQTAEEAVELGVDEAFINGFSLIEWPEIIDRWLPRDRLSLELTFGRSEDERIATIRGTGTWIQKLQIISEASW